MSEAAVELFKPNSIVRLKSGPDAENVHYHVLYDSVPHEFRILAEKTLGETETSKESGLKRLKVFMEKENLSTTDDILIAVLRACKYNVQKSETKLKRYLTYQKILHEKICRVSDEQIECVLEDTVFSMLPYRDKLGRVILITKPSLNLDKYSIDDIEVTFICFISYLLTFPMTSICGFSYIAESYCDSVYKICFIIKHFKRFVEFLLSAPLRLGRTDIVNENIVIRTFYKTLRTIIPKKMTQRIFVNGNSYTELHKAYPLDLLPKEFDGKMGPINCKFYKEGLMKHVQKIREEG